MEGNESIIQPRGTLTLILACTITIKDPKGRGVVPALAALVMIVENASFAVTCPNLVDLDGRKSAVKGENVSL